jgi:hypothetical protein
MAAETKDDKYWLWHCSRCEASIAEPRQYRDWYDGPLWECEACMAGPAIHDKTE